MKKGVWLVGLALLFVPLSADAQNSAAAEELFQRGVEALKADDFAKACPLLADSQQIDPRPGTLFTLADCKARWGKVASASAHFSDYLGQTASLPAAQASKHEARRKIAQQKLAELKPLIPSLTLTVDGGSPRAEVLLDNTRLGVASLGVALPVDPGEHSAAVRLDGQERSTTFRIRPGERLAVSLTLPAAPSRNADSDVLDPWQQGATPRQPGPVVADKGPVPGRSPLIYVAAGVGVVGVVVGSVGGLIALDHSGTIDKECRGSRCTPAGKESGDSANRAALLSTVGFGVGIAGLATAGVLFLMQPKQPDRTAAGRWRVQPIVRGQTDYGLLAGTTW